MRLEQIEIYSDASNAAVMRHPGRRFPGVLVQGDSLHVLCAQADILCENLRGSNSIAALNEANVIRNTLWRLLAHYKTVLHEHDIPLPFVERP